jgi:hypothetical protein
MYLPPLLEKLGLVELTHEKRNNMIRAIPTSVKSHEGAASRRIVSPHH